MKTFRNRHYTGRDSTPCGFIVACTVPDGQTPFHPQTGEPTDMWEPSTGNLLLDGLTMLFSVGDMRVYGHP